MAEFTTREMMEFILLEPTWYNGFCNVKTARTYVHRHRKEILTDESYEKIFAHFGFKKHTTWSN